MRKALTGRRQILIFYLMCSAVYFASYCTRINYVASITAITADMNIAKELAGIVSTGLFITYGAGQLISGILGDHVPPQRLIFIGIFGASILNIFMGLSHSIYLMIVLWCINGFCQAMLWPPLVRIMSELLNADGYKKGVLWVSVACNISTILIYLLVPLCITFSGWRSVFYICSAIGVTISIAWNLYIRNLMRNGIYSGVSPRASAAKSEKSPVKATTTAETAAEASDTMAYSFGKLVGMAGIIPIIFGIILHGILRDGVQTWMPAFIDETYGLGTSLSILTTVILPILSIISYPVATWLKKKFGNSELNSACFMFITSTGCSLLLLAFLKNSPLISIPLMAIVNASMHGINLMLISHVPQHFARYGRVSTVSGLLNSATYIGAASSTWGVALLSESFGWEFTIAIWAVIAAAGSLVLLSVRKRWNRFSEETEAKSH